MSPWGLDRIQVDAKQNEQDLKKNMMLLFQLILSSSALLHFAGPACCLLWIGDQEWRTGLERQQEKEMKGSSC